MQKAPSITELENKLSDMIGPSGGIQEARFINQFLALLNESQGTGNQDFLLQSMLKPSQNSKAIFDRFTSIGGVEVLGNLIRAHEKKEDNEAKALLHTILSILNKINVSVELLDTTKIGKLVSTLTKHPEQSVQAKSSAIIKK